MTSCYPNPLLYLNGSWHDGAGPGSEPVLNPATGEAIGVLRHASPKQLDQALDAAADAARGWRNTAPIVRGRILRDAAGLLRTRRDETAVSLVLEQGKPLAEAFAEIDASADILEWYAEEGRRAYGRVIPGEAGSRQLVVPQPVGPVVAFTPWNFPATSTVRKLGGALAAGCTIVVKPSEETPATPMALFAALHDAGLPAGVANLVFGVPADVASHLLAGPAVRKLSLTGSVAVGRHLSALAASRDIVTTMELGGNAPVVVFDDVDVRAVAAELAAAKFRNAGQVCNVPSRFFVHEAIAGPFIRELADLAREVKTGDGLAPGTRMGPLANQRRLDAVTKLVDDAVTGGATVVAGGRRGAGPGYFYQPTVLSGFSDEAPVFAEEVFGPVIPVTTFRDTDDVLRRANASSYGLGGFVFTASLDRATRGADELETGMVGVNTTVLSRAETPFGGIKASGHGQESGVEGLDAYLVRKTILQHPAVTA
ncbi:aldehyde dehydrogenase family protein [Saccharopolyspora sp. K220]|uniref:aldehyde dehydrogenase family protein n=1 Tax=Saccharopolyspora soli TaxID=2926618 RepID=UPI001F575D96|nr:aldehyde dehydrogenase family protein [Saccharopolyspora soli]MCI2419921.1 aldehyde dehydrogenase family protein [Saccharopolyspora soli]